MLTEKTKKGRGHTKTLNREDWTEQALRTLQDEGVAGVRVERLARDLDVTKGSFYWHFKDRADLLSGILDYWSDEFTGVITDNPEFQDGDPATRLYRVMEAIDERNLAGYDLAIRAWAENDTTAAATVRRVYSMRLKFVRRIFAELGFSGDELKMRTRTFVVYHSWQHTVNNSISRADRRTLRKLRHKMFTSK